MTKPKKVIEHPHVEVDGICGPAGTLVGHVHRSCQVDGIHFQCPHCLVVTCYDWKAIDAANVQLKTDPDCHAVLLPPCPDCGSLTCFNHNDIYYGLDVPEYHTMRAIREHVAARPAFKNLTRHKASKVDPRYQGTDFSNLEPAKRPACHRDPEE